MALNETTLPQLEKITSLPGLDSVTEQILISSLERSRETLEVVTGRRGNELDQMVTRRDLQNAGLDPSALDAGSDFVYEIDDFASIGSDNAPDPPSNFSVTNQVFANKLTWTNPHDADFTHVEVWMSTTNDRSTAYVIGLVAGQPDETSEFVHSGISTAYNYYYWIRSVDRGYNFSKYNPTDDTAGEEILSDTRQTINELLDELTDETQYSTSFELYYDVFKVIKPLDTFNAWGSGTVYSKDDVVKHDGSGQMKAYVCTVSHTSSASDEPGTGANWDDVWDEIDADVTGGGINVFTVGNIDGNPTVGIRGGLIIDGSILARHIEAESINATHIQAGTLTADIFESTLYGDLNQALHFVQTVLGAGDEYEQDLTQTIINNATKSDIEGNTHADYGLSVRNDMTRQWDDGSAWWDQAGVYWDNPIQTPGVLTTASIDIGSSKTLQLALEFDLYERDSADTTIKVEFISSTDDVNFGTNNPDLDDNVWETATLTNVQGNTYRAYATLHTQRYYKCKITITTTDTANWAVLYNVKFVGNVVNVYQFLANQSISSAGTSFSISGFNDVPAVTVTSVGTSGYYGEVYNLTSSGFDVKLFNSSGVAQNGTANIIIMGV